MSELGADTGPKDEGVSRADMQRAHTRDLYSADEGMGDDVARSAVDIDPVLPRPARGTGRMTLRFSSEGIAETLITEIEQ